MTANLSFEIDKRTDVAIIPASALQFSPRPEQVRECDRTILESLAQSGVIDTGAIGGESKSSSDFNPAKVNGRVRKYVWVPEGDLLMAVPIEIGLRNKTSAEVVSSRLAPGQAVVVGLRSGMDE
jgi:multidrug efflux pump subunit AcrA (membrane-fusion protein)